MSKNPEKTKTYWFTQLLLTVFSSVLFIFANPNFLFSDGLGFLAWFYYIPLLILIKKADLRDSFIFGFIYGFLSYGGYSYWLVNSYVAGLIAVILSYGLIYAILFEILKIIDKFFIYEGWIVQCLLLSCFEYVKTLGFLGLSYGVTAYTQWKYSVLIQSCDLLGVFGLNFLMLLCSGIIYIFILKYHQKKYLSFTKNENKKSNIKRFVELEEKRKINSLKFPIAVLICFSVLSISNFIYGFIKLRENYEYEKIKICAVQNYDDPWAVGFEEYNKSVKQLILLTDEALELYSDIDMVVWPETAVVPAIVYNYYNDKDKRRNELVTDLLRYIYSKKSQFVIGNGHKVRENPTKINTYNSALVFNPKENVIPPEPYIYSKHKLVPFTESFPFKNHFQSIYKLLLSKGNQMWTPGEEYTVFTCKGLKYSTPICFEDTFSTVCRNMVLNGSRAFVNLTNDSWSNSLACQKQHLAMATFRSVENRVPTVRCTNSGQTCIINSKGQIEAEINSFCKSYLIGEVEIPGDNYKATVFTKIGDVFGIVQLGILLFVLIMKLILVNINKH